MEFSTGFEGQNAEIIKLIAETFTQSDGAQEGELVSGFVAEMLEQTPQSEFVVFTASDEGTLIATGIFSRLAYEQDQRTVFLLAPMAVKTSHQGKGVGKALIAFALGKLRETGVDIAITYGDPAFYSKSGFQPISEEMARPPLKLNQPEGWIGQSLTQSPFTPLVGPSRCVPPLNNQDLW